MVKELLTKYYDANEDHKIVMCRGTWKGDAEKKRQKIYTHK